MGQCQSCNSNQLKKQKSTIQYTIDFKSSQQEDLIYLKNNHLIDIQQQYFEEDKFIECFKNYCVTQETLIKNWQRVDLHIEQNDQFDRKFNLILPMLAQNIRQGVPMDTISQLLKYMFKLNSKKCQIQMEIFQKQAFGIQVPCYFINVPYIQNNESFDNAIGMHFLNQEGINCVRKLLWLVQKFSVITLTPLILKIISLLIIFLNESETFQIIKLMIEESKKQVKLNMNLSWYFSISPSINQAFCKQFLSQIGKINKRIQILDQHFHNIKFDFERFFSKQYENLYTDYLPMNVVMIIYINYMNEGSVVFYKYTFAYLHLFKRLIQNQTNPQILEELLKEQGKNISYQQLQYFIQKSNFLKTSKLKLVKTAYSQELQNIEMESLHLDIPYVEKLSEIIQLEEFQFIWNALHPIYRSKKPILIWNSSANGFSLNNMYAECTKNLDKSMIMIIKTTQNRVIGFFSEQYIRCQSSHMYGGADTFVFEVTPRQIHYKPKIQIQEHIYSNNDFISIGITSNSKPAIQLCNEMHKGNTYKSEIYDNHEFGTSNEFICQSFELYTLQ